MPSVTRAQDAATDQSQPQTMRTIKAVEDDTVAIKVEQVSSPKFTRPLLDTPQTITVVTQEVLSQQGAATLVEALANTPGITMQLGENGNTSAGDTFSMRGSASQTNIFLDGIRDLAPVTRDAFNVAQVEIAKGAVGADYGRGATAGYINMVSKLPQLSDSASATASIDTGVSYRLTGDLNQQLGDRSALRLNGVFQDGDVVGRDYVENRRAGVAPAVAFGLGTATRFYLYSQHVASDGVPDGGIPSIGRPGFFNQTLATAGISPAAVDRKNFYGRYDDFEKTRVNIGTFRVEHDFSDMLHLVNTTRYGKSDMERVLTGINTLAFPDVNDSSSWTVSRSRQSVVQENELLTNQTNLTFRFNTGTIEHAMVSGIEYIKEQQYSPAHTVGAMPNANVYNPNAYDAFTAPYIQRSAAYNDGQTETLGAYLFDTVTITDAWLFTAGLRLDSYETDYHGIAVSTATNYPTLPLGTPVPLDLSDSNDLLSWKLGVVYKPVSIGSIYVSYSDSSMPPGGANFVLADPNAANATTNINRPGLDPQEATNIEIGTKWDLLNARLALSLAAYRTENRNEVSITDNVTQEAAAYGKRRVQGVEFGMVGKIADNWQLIAGLAWFDNEVVSGSTGNNAAGATARWAPEYSGNLWTTYTGGEWSAGLGANYVSEQKRVVDPTVINLAAQNVPAIPAYVVFNGMFSYDLTETLTVQLNVYNLFDKDYYSSLNNAGSRLTLGAERYGRLTAAFKF